jgi:serine/threonine protein kinase
MKTLVSTLGASAEVESIQRGLLRNLGLLGLALIALVTGAVVYFDEKLVDTLSLHLIDQSRSATRQELKSFFSPVGHGLKVAARQIELEDLHSGEVADRLFARLSPFVLEYARIDGLSVANMAGDAYVLFESGDGAGELLERVTFGSPERAGQARWRRWRDGRFVETWERVTDYRPAERPWFKAVEQADLGEVRWTAPYAFFTTKEPGITAAVRWRKPDTGKDFIAALDVSLTDISRFTMGLRPTPNGKVLVFADDERVIGLPAFDRFQDDHAFRSALLSQMADLRLPVLDAVTKAWEERGRGDEIFSFESGGATWWAGISGHDYGDGARLYVSVLIPESDFLADIGTQRNLALTAIVAGGVLTAVVLVLSTVGRVRRQIKQTVSQIERKLGQYRLKYKIGGGGNGDVYLARHALLRRPTAIKIMRPEFARSDSAKARFEHEVQITSGLTHPNTVAIYDFGKTPEDTLYYAMELLTGYTLENLVRVKGPLAPARVIHILEQVCGSLAEAHGKGLIHRDIKPANIMLCERGGLYDVVKVLDFGLVKEAGADDPSATRVDVLVGTPHYMAPEIISAAGQASPASDLYAVGAMAYYLLTGHNAFEGAGTVEICAKHLHDPPIPPSRQMGSDLPADLEALVLACLEKVPAKRPESAEALADRLRACADYRGWSVQDARAWWQTNQYELPLGEDQGEHTPLSNTALLVDMDERLERLRRTRGQTVG